MEQKTIGKFIAALRRANGYTQRELAEKLCVSDKAVSRWERDECAPDLMLLPVIAEIFGITTDELLRGKRNSPDHAAEEPRTAAKSEKQLKNFMRKKQTRYRNSSLISVGIAAVGLIAAMICNFGFLRARIGLLVGSIFYLAAVVCQICFANFYLSDPEKEEDALAKRLLPFNQEILNTSRNAIVGIVALFVVTLPLAFVYDTSMGMTLGSWFVCGLIFGIVYGLVCFLCHILFFDTLFVKKTAHLTGRTPYSPAFGKKIRRLFLRFIVIALAGAILPLFGMAIVISTDDTVFAKGTEHDSYESFKQYMEQEKDYNGEGWMVVEPVPDENGEYIPASIPFHDGDGNVVVEYYWNNREVTRISGNSDSQDRLPITTYTHAEIRHAYNIRQNLTDACGVLIAVECGLCLVTFFFKQRNLRREFSDAE